MGSDCAAEQSGQMSVEQKMIETMQAIAPSQAAQPAALYNQATTAALGLVQG